MTRIVTICKQLRWIFRELVGGSDEIPSARPEREMNSLVKNQQRFRLYILFESGVHLFPVFIMIERRLLLLCVAGTTRENCARSRATNAIQV